MHGRTGIAQIVTIGPQNRFASESDYSLWLHEVPEGEYVFYGFGMPGAGDCACMGTLAFDVTPGKVTAVRIGTMWLDAQGEQIEKFPSGSNSTDIAVRQAPYVEPPSDYSLDPRIPREMFMVPEFTLVNRLPNWFGGTVNRVLPVPGLFAYDGADMVDLRGGE